MRSRWQRWVCPLMPSGVAATDRANIQSVIEDSDSSICMLDQGTFSIDSPVYLQNGSQSALSGMGMSGASNCGTTISPSGYVGPVVVARNGSTAPGGSSPKVNPDFGTSLATGSGQSLQMDGLGVFVDYGDAPGARLNGLSACSIQLFVKFTTSIDGGKYVLSSYGDLSGDSSSAAEAFYIRTGFTNNLQVGINIGGTLHTATSANDAIVVDTVYYVEISYNGSNVYAYFGEPGSTTTEILNEAASGTVVQKVWEMVTLQGRKTKWPFLGTFSNPASGYVDSLRLSNAARNTSTFSAPTAKHSWDANTLLLQNWDQESDAMASIVRTVDANTSPGSHWLYKVGWGSQKFMWAEVANLEIATDKGIPLLSRGAIVQSRFYNLKIKGGICGIRQELCFGSIHERLDFDANSVGIIGLGFVRNSTGLSSLKTAYFYGGWEFPILAGESGGPWYGVHIQDTSTCSLLNKDVVNHVLIGATFKTTADSDFRGHLIIDGSPINSRHTFIATSLDSTDANLAPIHAEDNPSMVMVGCTVTLHGSATEVIEHDNYSGSADDPGNAVVLNCNKSQAGAAWSSDTTPLVVYPGSSVVTLKVGPNNSYLNAYRAVFLSNA